MAIFFTMRNNSYYISPTKKSLQDNKNASKKKNGSHMTTVNYQGSQQNRKFKMVDHDSDS